jgi:uncharacterized protein YbjT (DUF2867 family)
MNRILVTGGTGHLGTEVVRLLKGRGDHVRILARSPRDDPEVEWVQGDLSTGAGISDAVAGIDTIVHAATHSPAAQRGHLRASDFFRSPAAVDVNGTRLLLDGAARAGVKHFLYVSIVGVRQSRLPYARLKAAAEDLVRKSPLPWTIAPATPFYWLTARMLDAMARRRIWLLPSNLPTQPCDAADFAGYIADCVADGAGRDRPDFGGPEILTLVELARRYQTVRGIRRPIIGLPLPDFALRAAGRQTCPYGRHGKTTWSQWLASH